MKRIERLHAQLRAAAANSSPSLSPAPADVHVSRRDVALAAPIYDAVLTREALAFVADLAAAFASDIAQAVAFCEQLHERRTARRVAVEQRGERPAFRPETRAIRDDASWRVDPVPHPLRDRRVDIGDVSPADRALLLAALNSGAQGVQVDFDDGHCPTWTNTLRGHFHIMEAARGALAEPAKGQRLARDPALLIVRPRAWNMDEMNMLVDGVVVPGAVFDFALHLFHNGKLLFDAGRGPFLYLSKLEGAEEAALWRKIFEFTEAKLALPLGSIKATVLIENIFAAFEMDEILFELRRHSGGLNCGMWDYTASILVNFRHDRACLLPDRQQCVSMRSPFLTHYMELLLRTCKRRHALATTGMVPFVLDQLPPDLPRSAAVERATAGKAFEAFAGSDGALVFDLELVAPVQAVFKETTRRSLDCRSAVDEAFYEKALLALPRGFVTTQSVAANLRVALAYVLAWFGGAGTVVVNGCVEDSATAEISRAQLWQWIRHRVALDDDDAQTPTSGGAQRHVTADLVRDLLLELAREATEAKDGHPLRNVVAAVNLVFRVVTMRSPPPFMTTFLLEQEPLTRSLEQ